MALRSFNPVTPGRRFMTISDFEEITKSTPEKSLLRHKPYTGGRNSQGRETDVNGGGGHKRRYRVIDFRRNKLGIKATVVGVEYDPNRTSRIALLQYADGERRYIVAPVGLRPGDVLMSGPDAEIKPGNALPIENIPVGQVIYNVEIKAGRGGQIARSAGVGVQLVAKEGEYAQLRLPSGEVRRVHVKCYATIGQVGNVDHQNMFIGKAGRNRWLGWRPHTRGNAKNPCDHPLGGGEGRTKGGRHPCSRTGQKAKGLKTRNNKRTNRFIVRRRGSAAASVEV